MRSVSTKGGNPRTTSRAYPRWRASLRAAPLPPTAIAWQTVNISEGGAFVQTQDLLPPGSMLDLGLWLAAGRITGKVEVVWTNDPSQAEADPSVPIGMGLRFLGLGDHDRRLFRSYLAELERRSESAAPSPRKAQPARRPPPLFGSAAANKWPAADGPPLAPGMRLGSYRIVRLLGSGGMGAVYVARHMELDRMVAIKRLHARFATDPEIAGRFLAEARVVNQINHPNLIEITDFCATGEQPYFVMELLTGQTLGDAINHQGALPLARLLRIATPLATVLTVVHDAGVIHRDLKPQNIVLITRNGQPDFVKLLDFGVAKVTAAATTLAPGHTEAGVVLGTPGYMAPEQLVGHPVDYRTDIYAFGVILFQMATGRPPYLADSWGKLLLQQAKHETPRPSDIATHPIPTPLEALILSCLENRPGDRPATMATVRDQLQILSSRLSERRSIEVEAIPPVPARRSGLLGTAVFVLGALGATAITIALGLSLYSRGSQNPRPRARQAATPPKADALVRPSPPPAPAIPTLDTFDLGPPGDDSRRPAATASHRPRPAEGVRSGPGDREASRRGYARARRAAAQPSAEPGPGSEAETHYKSGMAALRDRKPLLAINDLEMAIALDPSYAPAFRSLGSAYAMVGREQKMVEMLERYLELAPDAPDAARIEQVVGQYRAK